jgi:hypothetical protein
MLGEAVAHHVGPQFVRRGEKAGAAGEGLGQAGGDEVHPVGQAQLGAQARALRPVRAQRMRLVDQDHAAVLLGHFHDLRQRADAPVVL